MTPAPDVTVVIPTVGRPVLRDCLDALLAGAVTPGHLIVVDQSGSATVAGWVEGLRPAGIDSRYLVSTGVGAAEGRNRGIEQVQTRFLATLDDDCVPDHDWLASLLERLRERPDTIVTGFVAPPEGGEAPSCITSEVGVTYTGRVRADVLYTGNAGMPRTVFDAVGPFSEAPVLRNGAEDNEWGYRALRAGFPIVYAPEVRVVHLDWRSPAQLEALERRYARGQGGFYGLGIRRGDWFLATRLLHDLLRSAKRLLIGVRRREWGLVRRSVWAAIEQCRGTAQGMTARRL